MIALISTATTMSEFDNHQDFENFLYEELKRTRSDNEALALAQKAAFAVPDNDRAREIFLLAYLEATAVE